MDGADGVVYTAGGDGELHAFAIGCATGGGTCTPLWSSDRGGDIPRIDTTPAVVNGVVYFEGSVCTPKACLPLWTGDTGGPIYSSPAVANGVVYVEGSGSVEDGLYAFDAAGVKGCSGGSCEPLWTRSLGESHVYEDGISSSPAVSNGVVYVGSLDGNLYAFGLPVDHLVLSPASATVAAGASQSYTAEGFDASNHDLGDMTGSTTFTIAGGSCAAAACTSSVSGDHLVTGTSGSATGTATLHVTAPGAGGATYYPLTPARILDSRDGTGGLPGPFSSHVARTLAVSGHGGVPANAIAVTGNLTVTAQTANGFLYIGPAAQNYPGSSTLNFPVVDDRANAVTVALGSGTISITYAAPALGKTAHVIFDVTGYFAP